MENKIIVFGRNPVYEYLRSITENDKAVLYISESAHGKIIDTIRRQAGEKHVKIEYRAREQLSEFEPSSKHQGVVLLLTQQSATNLRKDIDSFLEKISAEKGTLLLLDQLNDPRNLGSIIRSAEALGGRGVIITQSGSTDITSVVTKASAGATAHLPVHTVPNAAGFIDKAKKAGFWIIGASEKGSTNIRDIADYKPAVIIIGSEGSGMRRLTQEKCDYIVNIPLKGKISSLNASVAAGIILYELLKD